MKCSKSSLAVDFLVSCSELGPYCSSLRDVKRCVRIMPITIKIIMVCEKRNMKKKKKNKDKKDESKAEKTRNSKNSGKGTTSTNRHHEAGKNKKKTAT